jgi:ankyrin repeat protein
MMAVVLNCPTVVSAAPSEDLVSAAVHGDKVAVEALLANGVDVNSRESHGATALMLAALKGNVAVVQTLIAHGADVNAKASDLGATALMLAAQPGYLSIVQTLLDSGADVNAKQNDGTTALMAACEKGHLEVARKLLEKGADVNAMEVEGVTALMWATFNDHLDVLQALLAKGADINARQNDGTTALMWAIVNDHVDIWQALLASGADVNAQRKDGSTSLMLASSKGDVSAVRALLAKGADVNAKHSSGGTALTMAASNGHSEVVQLLKNANAITTGVKPQDSPLPLFDAFKAYCIDTNAQPNAIRQSVEAAGGKEVSALWSRSSSLPMGVAIWKLGVPGHSLTVSAGVSQSPTGHDKRTDVVCMVTSHNNEDASIEAARRWVGVAPNRVVPGDQTLYYYTYKELGSKRSALSSDQIGRDGAELDGLLCVLTLSQGRNGAFIQLVHPVATKNAH